MREMPWHYSKGEQEELRTGDMWVTDEDRNGGVTISSSGKWRADLLRSGQAMESSVGGGAGEDQVFVLEAEGASGHQASFPRHSSSAC